MKCAWQALLSVLPQRLRREVDMHGAQQIQQIRLRLGFKPLLEGRSCCTPLDTLVTPEDISFVLQTASRYSPWASESAARGYLTVEGGHRIGICGETVLRDGKMTGIRTPTSLCIRVAKQISELGLGAESIKGSVLIIGPPGSGKTTLLRELIRRRSGMGKTVCVVDERGELFPNGASFDPGPRTDVLLGCGKEEGIECVLRSMSPHTIAVDEITRSEDCASLLGAAWCGVALMATAHATNAYDLKRRRIYRPLVESGLFGTLLVMQRDQSFITERMDLC